MDRNAKIYWTYGKFKIVDDRTVRLKWWKSIRVSLYKNCLKLFRKVN